MRPEGLNFTNFISNYVFNPFSKELSPQEQCAALVSTIALTVFTLGMGTVLVGLGHLARYAATQLDSDSLITKIFGRALSQEEKDLQEAIKNSLEVDPSKFLSPEKVAITDGRTFAIKKTEGDGSCGVHALLGKEVKGKYYLENVEEVREQFCDYLSELKNKDDLPSTIQWIVEERKVDFDAYLEELANKETYLDQQELIALAAWKGIDLRIIQEDKDGRYTVTERPNPEFVKVPLGAPTQYVYYNGTNHFERAIEEGASS